MDKIDDKQFQNFYQTLRKEKQRDKYNFLFMGMTGAGKTTMVEYFLNILTGQVHAAKTLRAKELESTGTAGNSLTSKVCRYEIEYTQENVWICGITLIDTPGFADTGGLEKDKDHVQAILNTVSKLEEVNGVYYVVAGSLTRKTLEPLKVLCNVFSIMPTTAFPCVSTIITFCDNQLQASNVAGVLNEMLRGISARPLLYMDNPWYVSETHQSIKTDCCNRSQHLNNVYRSQPASQPETEKKDNRKIALPNKLPNRPPPQAPKPHLFGVDNTEELSHKLEAKTEQVMAFVFDRIRANSAFSPEGMSELNKLKSELYSYLAEIGKIVTKLHNIKKMLEALTDGDVEKLVEKGKSISLEEWCKSRGFAVFEGKPKSKIVGKVPFPGGIHSTVCFAPDCKNMTCHMGCSLEFTIEKGSNIFRDCDAFQKNENCLVCERKCSFKQHVHTLCQLEWIENDAVAETFYAIKGGVQVTMKKLDTLSKEGRFGKSILIAVS